MGFDTSMYSQIKPIEMQNPLTQALQVAQFQHAQGQNDLAKLVMGEKQREITENAALNDVYKGAIGPDGTINRAKLFTGAAQGGLGSKLPAMQKQFTESDKATADLDKTRFEVASKRFDTFQKVTGSLAQEQNLTKDMVVQAGRQLVEMGILPEAMYQQSLATMPDDPAALRQKLTLAAKSQMTPEQMFTVFAPKPTQIDNGQQISFRDTNPNSPTYGQVTGGAPVQKQQSPDSRASVGASLENAKATRDLAQSNRDAANAQRDQATEMKLADDYRAQSKEFGQATSAYKQITATLADATKSPAATLAAATKFMKILDPGSVVRESELGMALAASGVIDRATNYINILQRGKVLTATQAADFKNISDKMYKAAQQVQQTIDADYKGKAKTYKLRPEMIVQDLGQGSNVIDFGSLK